MKKLLILALICPYLTGCIAQAKSSPPYTVGDVLPPIKITNIINSSTPTINLEVYHDQLVILDFMATTCRGCIEKLPVLDSLQHLYGKFMQIVLVSYEDRQRLQQFLNSKWGKGISLPIATNDSMLKSCFPHRYLSHLVWIYKGAVIGITGSQYADRANVELVLGGRRAWWPVKKDFNEYDYSQPMLSVNSSNVLEESHPSEVLYTAFAHALDGVPARSVEQADSLKNTLRLSMINVPILQMWLKALELPASFPLSHTELQVTDTSRYLYDPSRAYRDQWWLRNSFCYEAVFPIDMPPVQRLEKVKEDLGFYLGCTARLEERTTVCQALAPKGGATKTLYDSATLNGKKLISISTLLYQRNLHSLGVPALNETGFMKEKYLPLDPALLNNEPYLDEVLPQYGLQFKKVYRKQRMLVLHENEH